ncbi:MAG: chromosomal replication initiator protein DnaA [Patescibacteria group bacterium]
MQFNEDVSQGVTAEEISQVWQKATKNLQSQLSPAVFSTWIASNPLTLLSYSPPNKALATITCPSAFHATNLKKNLYTQIKAALEEQIGRITEIEFKVGSVFPDANHEHTQQKDSKSTFSTITREVIKKSQNLSPTVEELFSSHIIQASIQDRAIAKARAIGLRLDYTFKTFAVSTSNEMAHAAASAVSNSPGSAYNPLFLYGGVGVGKTHLMHAIGNNILKKNPETHIIYCTGEEFTNEIVSAIQTKKALSFKQKYRNTSVLLIDDIQFIAGKNTVQEEFFHTFNALVKQSAQVVLTSDRPPHEINLLEDRLRSRFEAGLMIDIQQPSFELRTAILLIKSQALGINLPMDFAQQIAEKVDSARKIEGVINFLRSEVELKGREINQQLVQDFLKIDTSQKTRIIRIKPQDLIKKVATHYGVKQSAIKGKSRTKDLVYARHVAMFLLRNELKMSLEEIGKWFSGRDHTSVLHAIQRVDEIVQNNEEEKSDISSLKMSLGSSFT